MTEMAEKKEVLAPLIVDDNWESIEKSKKENNAPERIWEALGVVRESEEAFWEKFDESVNSIKGDEKQWELELKKRLEFKIEPDKSLDLAKAKRAAAELAVKKTIL